MGREENVQIFKDTENLCRTNNKLAEAVKRATAGQKLILEGEEYQITLPEEAEKAETDTGAKIVETGMESQSGRDLKIVVSKKRTLEAAAAYKGTGKKICVHNFASATNPGGGVTKGSSAQEECLCRCSALYFSLNTKEMWDGFYTPHRQAGDPLHNDDCIYTPDVMVFKTDTANPVLMKEEDWYSVDVITCAAPNLREKPANSMNPGAGKAAVKVTDQELLAIHEKRMRRFFEIALRNGAEIMITGAFGCGAFSNSPEVVARAMKTVVKEYEKAFKMIEFAVYCPPADDRNYQIFRRVLGAYGIK